MNTTDEQKKEWARDLCAAGVEAGVIADVLREIAESVIIKCIEFEEAMAQIANIIRLGLVEAANELEELEALRKKAALLELPTAWDRKEAREKQRAVERAASSRFRQYRTRESAWSAQKRTGPRRREWRGPWRER